MDLKWTKSASNQVAMASGLKRRRLTSPLAYNHSSTCAIIQAKRFFRTTKFPLSNRSIREFHLTLLSWETSIRWSGIVTPPNMWISTSGRALILRTMLIWTSRIRSESPRREWARSWRAILIHLNPLCHMPNISDKAPRLRPRLKFRKETTR